MNKRKSSLPTNLHLQDFLFSQQSWLRKYNRILLQMKINYVLNLLFNQDFNMCYKKKNQDFNIKFPLFPPVPILNKKNIYIRKGPTFDRNY